LPAGLAFASGLFYGIEETAVYHPDRFPKSWNKKFFNNSESWRNKWKNGDKTQGEKFPGSSTVFVWATDAKHLFGSLHRATLFSSGFVLRATYTIGEKRKFSTYLIDSAVIFASFATGFHAFYSLI